jgi:hypothetical protein
MKKKIIGYGQKIKNTIETIVYSWAGIYVYIKSTILKVDINH